MQLRQQPPRSMRKLIVVLLAASFLAGTAEAVAAASKRPPVKSPCIDLPPERQARRSSRDLQGLFRPDPPDRWRRAAVDRRNTTSDCVGDPVTPACAIDTMMAAFVAYDIDLHRAVYPDPANEPAFARMMNKLAQRNDPSDIVYRIHRVSDPAAGNGPRSSQPRYGSPLKGDTIEIVLEEQNCSFDNLTMRPAYILQHSETGWRIIESFDWDRR